MKTKKVLGAIILLAVCSSFSLATISCNKETNGGNGVTKTSKITGVVTDTQGKTISDVDITIKNTDSGKTVISTAKSGSNGEFSLGDIPAKDLFLVFSKDKYSTVGMTVPGSRLLAGEVKLTPILEFANAVIKGKVLDAQNGNAPLAGVNVNIGVKSMETGTDGTYEFSNLTIQDYSLVFTKAGCMTITKKVSADMFSTDGVFIVDDISMGGKELLPGLTLQDLKGAAAWYSNEYRGGFSRGGGELDWSTTFMSCQIFNWVGNWEMQNEGCTLRIRNDEEGRKNPADQEHFDTFIYGRKLITADNKILTVNSRCHQAPCFWGVQIIDLSLEDPATELIGEIRKNPGSDYIDENFDLGKYIGHEVIIAIGQFRMETGNYWHQFVLAHISFAPEANKGDKFLPGAEVPGLEGWHMTGEMVRSTMPNTRNNFIGTVPSGLNVQTKGNPAYHNLAGTGHIASEWAFQYVSKDAEPLVSEGFVIKTRGGADSGYNVPESYFYSKFRISAGHDKIVLKARNFDGSVPTVFKFTVITEDLTVNFIDPVASAESASKVDGGAGCWQFINNKGGKDVPGEYGSFTYDLSAFDGKDVMVCLGVHKGNHKDGEQKLCIYSVDVQ